MHAYAWQEQFRSFNIHWFNTAQLNDAEVGPVYQIERLLGDTCFLAIVSYPCPQCYRMILQAKNSWTFVLVKALALLPSSHAVDWHKL